MRSSLALSLLLAGVLPQRRHTAELVYVEPTPAALPERPPPVAAPRRPPSAARQRNRRRRGWR